MSPHDPVDFEQLYERHPEYEARRQAGSAEQALIDLEVRLYKLPHLAALVGRQHPSSVVEIGCATGELIAAFPVNAGGCRTGVDISPANVAAAAARFPDVEFLAGDFTQVLAGRRFDLVVLSDVLEHVPDDVGFLREAAALGSRVLVNVPIEDNWLNARRRYGPHDASGHLRRYGVREGLALFERAGLYTVAHEHVWFHESPAERERRRLRAELTGAAYAGGPLGRRLRQAAFASATVMRPLGRRLFASNLFALLEARRASR